MGKVEGKEVGPCAPHRRSPPSPRRSPPGRGPRGDAGARTSRATEAAARSSSRIRSMIPVNASSFGRRRGMLRRYPGGTENDSILRTVLRSNPNTREAWRVLIPATRHARRTRAHISTRYIPPPSSQSNTDRRLYAVPFLVRRSRINRPPQWGIIAPPFSSATPAVGRGCAPMSPQPSKC